MKKGKNKKVRRAFEYIYLSTFVFFQERTNPGLFIDVKISKQKFGPKFLKKFSTIII